MTHMQPVGGQELTDTQFRKLAEIVHQESGIVLTGAKRGLLAARLNRRLRTLGISNYGAYCDRLDGREGAEERRHLLSAMTTNVTAFFREGHHFNVLATNILPSLIAAAKSGMRVRLWSAACSSGEEAYSIAMTVLEACPDIHRHDLLILATDIDPQMVARAEEGKYPEEVLRTLQPARLQRFFNEDGDQYVARPELRRIMRFAELNLHDRWPFTGQFDVAFCRNVVIYFDCDMRQNLWSHFAQHIKPGGQLFIGHSERLDGPAAQHFELVGATQYHRRRSTLSHT